MIRRTIILACVAGLLAAGAAAVADAQPSATPFEIVPGSFAVTPSTLQAGAHEDLTVNFDLAHEASPEEKTFNDVKTTVVNLPPGFIGNNNAVPTCTQAQLLTPTTVDKGLANGTGANCPPATQVGTITFDLNQYGEPIRSTFPIYNMEVATPGVAAQLGFHALILTQILTVDVRPGDSGLTVTSPNIEEIGEVHAVSVTTWGVPNAHSHDAERGRECFQFGPVSKGECGGGFEEVTGTPKPFLSNPTSCGPFEATIKSNSWEEPGNWSEAEAEVGPIAGCERVHFDPTITADPTTKEAESSTGLDVALGVPQTWEKPESIATGNLKDAVVRLPQGMSLNPSAGSGLGSCTEAQFNAERFDSLPGEGCPAESKVGAVEVETPVLAEKATGSLYVAKPFDNPFHSLLALYIVAKIPSRGIIVKVAGNVHADPLTGQLTTTFDENPQVPFNRFTLKFRQGATSPLVSPPTCGAFTAEADLTPWSAPLEPHHLTSSFPIEQGVRGGPCPSGGLPPFHPGLIAGSLNNAAGHYSPFYIRLSRQDGEQEITHFSIKLPPGVIGKLAGIPLCTNAQVAQAKDREVEGGGATEEADPSCPAASEVGHTIVEAGVGTVLAQAPGKIYLAGPYHGAPVSVVAVTSANVGPFDLGTVVIREALKVNPETGEVFVDATGSDPLPHIVDGIPTHLREVRIYMDRPEFVLNPTSCEPTSTASTVLGSGKDFVSEADDNPLTVTSPFQAADCAALPFKPKLTLRLKGSTKRGGNPALQAHLAMRGLGEAGVAYAQVALPPTEFLDNAHIGGPCTRAIFKEGAVEGEKCPAASIIGHAKAVTPILSEPLEGPVYLRSNPERNLPDIAAALHGQEISVVLVGHTDSAPGGGLRNTFEVVPDAPVNSFDLDLFGGHKGLLENAPKGTATSICGTGLKATVRFKGHNGKLRNLHDPIHAAGCHKHKKHKRHHR